MKTSSNGKMIIFSAPSGAGKTTIVKALMEKMPRLEFSVSATSRQPRQGEQNGRDYYFLSAAEFDKTIEQELFVEWEEVYAGTRYGTLKSEVERIWDKGNVIVFDVDVKGGLRLKSIFGDKAVSIFVMPPSVEELRSRLIGRGTDAPEVIEKRVDKAEYELGFSSQFDKIIVNEDLQEAVAEAESIISEFIA